MNEEKSESVSDVLQVLATDSDCEGSDLDALVKISTPPGVSRSPVDMVCVVDVSGSMAIDAEITADDGGKERHGLTILNVVQHAVKTVCNILGEHDRLAIVSYAEDARVEIGLTKCNKAGQARIGTITDRLEVRGQTNLWDGLYEGMELLRKGKKNGRLQSVLLLTDGLPNVNPPDGELEMLRRYRDEHGAHCSVSTFGFGYQLDSELLNSMAVEGNGSYCFIPDAGFVGTIFIHATSNILTTWANNGVLSLEPMNGAKITEVLGGHHTTPTSWGSQVVIGGLLYGQSRDIVVRLSLAEEPGGVEGVSYVKASLKLTNVSGEEINVKLEGTDRQGGKTVTVQRSRSILVDTLQEALVLGKDDNLPDAQAKISGLVEAMKAEHVPDEEVAKEEVPKKNSGKMRKLFSRKKHDDIKPIQGSLAEGLLKDVSGQGVESLSTDALFQKWGRHYLPSLIRAHQLQQCNNFKDPGVQLYGGSLFQSTRDVADDIFLSLPAPKGYLDKKPVDMQFYHNAGGGCIADGDVLMADGSTQNVQFVKKGDRVFCPESSYVSSSATVLCVVKTPCEEGENLLVDLQGMLLTPWHPVRVGDVWKFPDDLAPTKEYLCKNVYSFVLDNGHVMLINGVPCVTLGHNLKGEVVEHSYYGTSRILDDLREMTGWNRGLITLSPKYTVRDPQSGLVIGINNRNEKERIDLTSRQQLDMLHVV